MMLTCYRRSAFFLFEVLIAMVLVALFSLYFFRSSVQESYREKELLLNLEWERIFDLKRMETIATCWREIDTISTKKGQKRLFKKEVLSIELAGRSYSKTYEAAAWRGRYSEQGSYLTLEEKIGSHGKESGSTYHFFVKKG